MNNRVYLQLNRSLITFALLIAISLGLVALPVAAQTHKPVVPAKPSDLIKLLPVAPAEWKMTNSTAKSYFIGWMCSQATRQFEHPAPPLTQPGATPSPPFITRIQLMDTGFFPTFNGDFDNFQIGKYSNAESLTINGMPARKITISRTRERLRVSIRGRFIVEVETDNQPSNSAQSWLQLFDFKKISAILDTGATQLPQPIVVETIDELQPTKSSTSELHWGGPVGMPGQ